MFITNYQDIIQRELFEKIWRNIDEKEYIAIVGPRQVGKTTLLSIIKEKILDRNDVDSGQVVSATFQDPIDLHEYEKNPVEFIKKRKHPELKTYFLLDEYQYAKDGGNALKLIYDTVENVKIIITGSSALEIRSISSKMVGRIFSYYLSHLTISEIVNSQSEPYNKRIFQNLNKLKQDFFEGETISKVPEVTNSLKQDLQKIMEELCTYGGYPAVFTSKNHDLKKERLLNIYNTYVEKDIIQLLNIGKTDKFLKLVQYLSIIIGNLYNNSTIQRELDMHYEEVEKFLESLEQTYIVKQIKPFFSNKSKELKKATKIYFHDLGIRNWSIQNFQSVSLRADQGAVIENYAMSRLNNFLDKTTKNSTLHYWRKTSGAEVDFVVNSLGSKAELIPIEIKNRSYNKPEFSKSFVNFTEEYSPKRGMIITKNFYSLEKLGKTEVLFLPVYLL